MWIENKKLTSVDTALQEGKPEQLDQILSEILQTKPHERAIQICPQCHKDLVHKKLPYLEIFVSACPDNHGVWMMPEVYQRFRDFLSEQISVANKRRYRLKILWLSLCIVLVFAFAVHVQRFGPKSYELTIGRLLVQAEGRAITPDHWPQHDYTNWYPLPAKESAIDHIDELSYIQEWMTVMEEGATNRVNIAKAFSVTRPKGDYIKLADFYTERQNEFLRKLSALDPPERLKGFHETVMSAAKDQVEFYNRFAEMKYKTPSLKLGDVLQEPSLQECNRKLWEAYYSFRDLYPERDTMTNDAVEQRLCLFDII